VKEVKAITGRAGILRIDEHNAGRFFYDLILYVMPHMQASAGGPYASVEAARDAVIRTAVELNQRTGTRG